MESAAKSETTIVPLVRERPMLHGLAATHEKRPSIAFLKERLTSLMASGAGTPEAALGVLSILQHIVLHESGRYQFDDGLEETLHQLSAGGVVSEAFQSLYRRSKQVLHDMLMKKEVPQTVGAALIEDAQVVLEWYGERSQSLVRIQGDEKLLRVGAEGFFNYKILHDRDRSGVFGSEVKVGMLLDSHGSETLWLRAQVLFRGKPVQAAIQWRGWTTMENDNEFAVEVPLYCKDGRKIGRTIVDTASLFIPYAAISWPQDVHGKSVEASVVLSVHAHDGEKLFSQSYLETLRILSPDLSQTPMIAPQEVELWSSCPVEGHSISRVQMYWVEDAAATGHGKIEVQFDAVLFGCAGREVSVCARILDEQGNGIESINESVSDPRGLYLNETIMAISSAISRWNGFSLVINPHDLVLLDGDNAVTLEIAMVDASGRALCGILEPFTVSLV